MEKIKQHVSPKKQFEDALDQPKHPVLQPPYLFKMLETVFGGMSSSSLSTKNVNRTTNTVTDYVDLKKLPEFGLLNKQVSAVVEESSWWDRYGVDMLIHVVAAISWLGSHCLLAFQHPVVFWLGIIVMGCSHSTINLKAAHMAVHDAACSSREWNRFWTFIFSDYWGTFSADVSNSIHIKVHHPHTNIIGLGDSSTWKAPFLPRFCHFFIAPLLLPVLTPVVALKELLEGEPLWKTARHMLIAYSGLAVHLYLLTYVSGLGIGGAFLAIFLSRNVLAVPYIHVNIFQHIGLPMYSQKHRPKKIYQMTTGVLNLPRNIVLDYCFGHSIISCHTEHHLFPRLSDNMCLKVKPMVRQFCLDRGLPYHEDTYTSRMLHFLKNYNSLMVDAPPITKFVGLQ
ncbi:fatty acid desaturase 6-like [Plakobranchus ocellatus]|uniref:Fatty acid desaturase 6-like n=1 Tax=Plakobranchus ocellatus TaxID=259542 RepID=A0AAV4ANK3_9GAST|nr:fatty acid desaturase 6-like [Plakobranchus ocellatus]